MERRILLIARNEVILSAGAIASLQLLELSGIGDRKLLEKYGIECKVENPKMSERECSITFVSECVCEFHHGMA